jgi:hypothetical protein
VVAEPVTGEGEMRGLVNQAIVSPDPHAAMRAAHPNSSVRGQ